MFSPVPTLQVQTADNADAVSESYDIIYTDAAEQHYGLFLQWNNLADQFTGPIPQHMWKRPAAEREMYAILKAMEKLKESLLVEAHHSIAIYNDNKVAIQILDKNGASSSYALQALAHEILSIQMTMSAHIAFFFVAGTLNLADHLSRPASTQAAAARAQYRADLQP